MNSCLKLECGSDVFLPFHAWVNFRPTRYGFSVWTCGEDDVLGKIQVCSAKVKCPYDWRQACKSLLNLEEGNLFGDFRNEIEVTGESHWQAELLKLCWIRDDELMSSEAKSFLLSLSDEDLASLHEYLCSFMSDESIAFIELYIQTHTNSPLQFIADELNNSESFSLEKLTEVLEKQELDLEKQKIKLLQPYESLIEEVMTRAESLFGKQSSYAGGVGTSMKKNKLRTCIETHINQHNRMPSDVELNEMLEKIQIKTSLKINAR